MVWDLESGARLLTLQGHRDKVTCMCLTADSRRVVSGGEDKSIRIWDLETGVCIHTLQGHSETINSVSVTPDGRRAVSASSDKTLRVWDLETGACLHTLKGHRDLIRCVCCTPDGHRAISGSDDNTLRVWDLESAACWASLRLLAPSFSSELPTVAKSSALEHRLGRCSASELKTVRMRRVRQQALGGAESLDTMPGRCLPTHRCVNFHT